MAVKAVQLIEMTEETYDKAPDGIDRVPVEVPGVGTHVTYWRKEYVDDLTEKPAEGTVTVNLLVPVDAEREEVVIGEDGEPEKNEDGSDKLKVVGYTDYEAREIDLSPASLKKLMTALKPFAAKSRERVVSVPASRPAAASSASSPNPKLTEWNRRVKAWLEANRPEYGVLANTRGRVKGEHETLYVQQNPTDPKPV
ncbi:Lsr2 family protein [Streptomyces prunicolor]|uniref:Lsr2 family protein n=1 Tax=Streptomyces prunicolor TaxID=67348 RepID=UPI000367D35A|nr:Lsr2 family protein [Streptomyces prunicolor]